MVTQYWFSSRELFCLAQTWKNRKKIDTKWLGKSDPKESFVKKTNWHKLTMPLLSFEPQCRSFYSRKTIYLKSFVNFRFFRIIGPPNPPTLSLPVCCFASLCPWWYYFIPFAICNHKVIHQWKSKSKYLPLFLLLSMLFCDSLVRMFVCRISHYCRFGDYYGVVINVLTVFCVLLLLSSSVCVSYGIVSMTV